MTTITQTILYTDAQGYAKFRDQTLELNEGTDAARLSLLSNSSGYQFRQSPVGFHSDFHCTTTPQWLIVLLGAMEIGLQDGSTRVFSAGQSFYSNDTLPVGALFDGKLHGHCSRQLGEFPLQTVFIRSA